MDCHERERFELQYPITVNVFHAMRRLRLLVLFRTLQSYGKRYIRIPVYTLEYRLIKQT